MSRLAHKLLFRPPDLLRRSLRLAVLVGCLSAMSTALARYVPGDMRFTGSDVSTQSAQSVDRNSATLRLNTKNANQTTCRSCHGQRNWSYRFLWGSSASPSTPTPEQVMPVNLTATSLLVTQSLSFLSCGKTYFFRGQVKNNGPYNSSSTPRGWFTATNTRSFSTSACPPPAPASDNFASAAAIPSAPTTVLGSNVGATAEAGEPVHDGRGGRLAVWWRFVAPLSGHIIVDTFGSDFNTVLAVYTGSSVGNTTHVASDDDTFDSQRGSSLQSKVSFFASAGTVLSIAVDGFKGSGPTTATGSIRLNLSLDTDNDGTPNQSDDDTDGDGMGDRYEQANGLNALSASDRNRDLDNDGLSNFQEFELGTLPNNRDSDGDSVADGTEIRRGTDPLVPRGAGFGNEPPPAASNLSLQLFKSGAPGHLETEVTARAYYRAVDPFRRRTTLAKFKATNGLSKATDLAHAIYLNDMDLGFARDMYVWTTPKGHIASYVENYGDNSFDPANGDTIDKAVDGPAQEILRNAINGSQVTSGPKKGFLATVAMEYSPPDEQPSGQPFTKFFVYEPDGKRLRKIDLDGTGDKFVPGVCNICHGGNPRPMSNSPHYLHHGDTNASFLPWDLDTYAYSTKNGYRRNQQLSAFRAFNEKVLKTNPTPAIAEAIRGWYGVPPDQNNIGRNRFDSDFVPDGWIGNEALYLGAFAPNCRACHISRPSPVQQMRTYRDFDALSDRIASLIFDQGVMPLAQRTYRRFWSNTEEGSAPHLIGMEVGRDPTVNRPDQQPPLTVAGSDHFAREGRRVRLNGRNTVHGRSPGISYQWTLLNAPSDSRVEIKNADSARANIRPDVPGNYHVRLETANQFGDGPQDTVKVFASRTGTAVDMPQAVLFDDKTDGVAAAVGVCLDCHDGSEPLAPNFLQARGDESRNEALYRNLATRVNTREPANSLLLQKPTESIPHGGFQVLDLDDDGDFALYTTLIRWIEQGARWLEPPRKTQAGTTVRHLLRGRTGRSD